MFETLSFMCLIQKHRTKRTSSQESLRATAQNNAMGSANTAIAKIKRRKTIPEKPNYSLNLWSIMKNCIGKELTKIPMPVSILQVAFYKLM